MGRRKNQDRNRGPRRRYLRDFLIVFVIIIAAAFYFSRQEKLEVTPQAVSLTPSYIQIQSDQVSSEFPFFVWFKPDSRQGEVLYGEISVVIPYVYDKGIVTLEDSGNDQLPCTFRIDLWKDGLPVNPFYWSRCIEVDGESVATDNVKLVRPTN